MTAGRALRGLQTAGRDYRDLSEPVLEVAPLQHVRVPMSDGRSLAADIHLPLARDPDVDEDGSPVGGGPWPTLVSFSCYPRQVQDLRAPLGFVEAGVSDFFVTRGYAHVLVNARGTGGSDGVFGLGDARERRDAHDVVEWAAAQPWSDGQVGGMGISYFAIAQLGAATERPPHLRAIFPFATLGDMYDAVWHDGVRSSGFIDAWLAAVGILGGRSDAFWGGRRLSALRRLLALPAVQARLPEGGGATAVSVLRRLFRQVPAGSFSTLWRELAVGHPTRDDWWDVRSLRERLSEVDIGVYLGCQWDNVPMHLPGTFDVWEGLRHNPHVRMTLVDAGALAWPWESLHTEALAWYDHWLKGRDTGIMDGPPVRYVVPGDGRWRTATSWPPLEAQHVAYALRADGVLDPQEGVSGGRVYVYPGTTADRRRAVPDLGPDRLCWRSGALAAPIDVVGEIELELEATITALDTSWVVVLSSEAPDGARTTISAGWLRAQLRTVDEDASRPGRPVLPCRVPVPVSPGVPTRYRIRLVPNARRLLRGHRLHLVVASSDIVADGTAVLGFTHTPVGEPSVTTILSTSRLLLPVV